jgi:hypothetical protein
MGGTTMIMTIIVLAALVALTGYDCVANDSRD